MKRTLLTMSLVATLAAGAAFAQEATTETTGSGSAMYGSDWSQTLGSAVFSDDGTTVRPAADLTTQWQSMSEEDKTMVQRDCMMHMQQAGAATDTTGAAASTDATASTDTTATTDTTASTDTTATTDTTGAAASTDSTTSGEAGMPMNVSAEQMDQICASMKDM